MVLQEINEMLSNIMTADDEDAVQRELAQLQADAAPPVQEPHLQLPDAPVQEPVAHGLPPSFTFASRGLKTFSFRGATTCYPITRAAPSCARGIIASYQDIVKSSLSKHYWYSRGYTHFYTIV